MVSLSVQMDKHLQAQVGGWSNCGILSLVNILALLLGIRVGIKQ